MSSACRRAENAGVDAGWVGAVRAVGASLNALAGELSARGRAGGPDLMLRHSADYLELFSTYAVAWQWLLQAAAAKEGLAREGGTRDLYEGKLAAAQYWIRTELPKNEALVALCRDNEDSYQRSSPGGSVGKGRLEAFSDGVLAIVVTLVLALRVPARSRTRVPGTATGCSRATY